MNRIRLMVLATAVAAVAAAPGIADAGKPANPGSKGNGKGSVKRCAKQAKRGFTVKGTFVSGDATTVELLITKVNRHAKAAGYDPGETVSFTPPKPVRYLDYEPGEAPDTDDRVHVRGKALFKKKKCGGPTTVFDRVKDARVFDK